MGDGEGALNLDGGNLANAAVGATRAFNLWLDGLLPAISIAALLALVIVSMFWARNQRQVEIPESCKISSWTPSLKACLWPFITAFALTHAFSAFSVYYNTSIANPTTAAYFEAMGIGRLASLSHAHLFAHATMYFLLALLVQLTSAGKAATLYAPIGALWAGVFDVVSWWGLKKVSAHFEILSAICGTLFSLGFLLMSYAILRETMRKDRARNQSS
jgi:hypothetical protein